MKIKTLGTGVRCCSKFSGRSTRERDSHRDFEDAPHGSTIFFKIFRTLRTGAQFFLNFEDAPHGSAIFFKIFRTLRTAARFFLEFSRCSARERDFDQTRTINFKDVSSESAILKDRFINIFKTLRTGARFWLRENNLERNNLA